MRRLILLTITAVLLSIPVTTLAVQDEHNQSVDGVLAEIKTQQNVAELKDIDCDQVTDGQWEELGEAVMSIMHPDEEEHELMDQMMGGEDSDSLKAMHISMGRQYLGCSSSSGMMGEMMGGGMMKMMKGGMMNNLLTNPSLKDSDGKWRHSMMGNFGLFGFGWIFMILFWVLVILVIVWLVKTLAGKTSGQAKNLTAQEILKQRYAKGEISKKEFEQMKKDIS
jgi:uncharacterized membrane protein